MEEMMPESIQFASQGEFRVWLEKNGGTSGGVWLLFGKSGGPKTISANEALEEALCFGWIDGQMQSLDSKSYIKYFSLRRENSNWSEKNKAAAADLEKRGLMTDAGRAKIAEAKKNGQWEKPKAPAVTEEQIAAVTEILREYEPAHTNFQAMSPSVKKTYTRAYFDAKTDQGRSNRLAWMVDRLNKNLKPM
ncbi:YdeI/OmpD-associated family protein [Treponema sp. OttesenSCG-928-L16]|nr:YdeI/OmpD-associated family protein [Treponema sp. OttesenSCG-928-L16]